MPYSQFTLEDIKTKFGIKITESFGIFSEIPEINYSDFLQESLQRYVPLALAIDTEKARSELIISPILVELKIQCKNQISLFSGKDFNVDAEQGLNGRCDFLISQSSEQLIIESPFITLVEAKNDNLQFGFGQCIAEMIAAQVFNQRQNQEIKTIYGVITTGSLWKFLRLKDKDVEIDISEYFLHPVGKILGILKSFIASFD